MGWCGRCYGIGLEPYYSDGERSIYHGDCRTILPLIQAKVDLVLTDPPYDAEAHTKGRRQRVDGVGRWCVGWRRRRCGCCRRCRRSRLRRRNILIIPATGNSNRKRGCYGQQ